MKFRKKNSQEFLGEELLSPQTSLRVILHVPGERLFGPQVSLKITSVNQLDSNPRLAVSGVAAPFYYSTSLDHPETLENISINTLVGMTLIWRSD